MALKQLSLGTNIVDGDTNGVDVRLMADDGSKAPRLPRWTRQEILVLIQGKRVAENRVRRGRTVGLAFGTGQVEPKWASVSTYCKRHGVNRGPVQCRKRWSNLAGDYKKIKEWENQIKEEMESFWVMRNDFRRERKLPGFFDKEVYDILDGAPASLPPPPPLDLALGPAESPTNVAVKEIDTETEAVFDSGRSAAAEDGLFSDFEQEEAGIPEKKSVVKEAGMQPAAAVPISEQQCQPYGRGDQGQGTTDKLPGSNPEIGSTSHEGRKRKRITVDGDEETTSLHSQLIDTLERNSKMLIAQLEAQNTNFQLDQEQRKAHGDCYIAVLNKLADALGRIADKL